MAAISSFFLFAIGAIIPLMPYLFGVEKLWPGLACGAVGLLLAGELRPGSPRVRCGSVPSASWPSG